MFLRYNEKHACPQKTPFSVAIYCPPAAQYRFMGCCPPSGKTGIEPYHSVSIPTLSIYFRCSVFTSYPDFLSLEKAKTLETHSHHYWTRTHRNHLSPGIPL